jgi:hypothetical protein
MAGIYECTRRVEITDAVMAESEHEAAAAYKGTHGVLPDQVDGCDVLGACENCARPILEGDGSWVTDLEGVRWHMECPGSEEEA